MRRKHARLLRGRVFRVDGSFEVRPEVSRLITTSNRKYCKPEQTISTLDPARPRHALLHCKTRNWMVGRVQMPFCPYHMNNLQDFPRALFLDIVPSKCLGV